MWCANVSVRKMVAGHPAGNKSQEEEQRAVVAIVVDVDTVVLATALSEGAAVVFISESRSRIVPSISVSLRSLTRRLDISPLPHL